MRWRSGCWLETGFRRRRSEGIDAAVNAGGCDGKSDGLGFEEYVWESFPGGGQNKQVCGFHDSGEVMSPADEVDGGGVREPGGELFEFGSIGAFSGDEESDPAGERLVLEDVQCVEQELWGFLCGESAGHEDDEVGGVESELIPGDCWGEQELVEVDTVLDHGDVCRGNTAEGSMLAGDVFAAGDVVRGEFSGAAIGEYDEGPAVGDADTGDVAGDVSE